MINAILFTEGKVQEEEGACYELSDRYPAGPIADDKPTSEY
jgi:hypothetical protein